MAYSNNGGGGGRFNKGSYGGGYNSGGGGGSYDRGDSSVLIQDDTIFVSGMGTEVTEVDIANHFGCIGIIKKDKRTQKPKIWIYKDKATGGGKGECTITYDDAHTATSAIEWFDGKEFNGNVVKVQLAQRSTNNASWQNKGKKFGSGPSGGERGGGGGGRSFGGPPSRGDSSSDGPRRGGGGGSGGGQSREGDWVCAECSNKNFAWRNECNRCKNPRSDGGGGGSAPRNMSSQRDRNDGGNYRSEGGNYRGNYNQGPMRGSGPGGNRQRPY